MKSLPKEFEQDKSRITLRSWCPDIVTPAKTQTEFSRSSGGKIQG